MVRQVSTMTAKPSTNPQELRPILGGFLRRRRWLTNATFLINRKVRVGRRRWTVGLSVVVFGDPDSPPPHKVQFIAGITFFPPEELSQSEESYLDSVGFYDRVLAAANALGYHGGWSIGGFGKLGTFSKDLRSRRELWAEVVRLETMDVRSLVGAEFCGFP